MPRIDDKELAQMLMVGFEGVSLPDDYYDWLERGLGGIILFSRNIENPEQLAHLTDEVQYASRKAKIPALIGADQEGGRVFRLKEPFTHFPTAENIGKAMVSQSSPQLAYDAARATALELSAMGIRLNFAPILDINSNPNNPIIGDRAFHADAEKVAEAALAYIRGLQDVGVIACGKHFPGHGGTSKDSHLELPVVSSSLKDLEKLEFIPFQRAFLQGLELLMPAHVLYPALDSEWPATLSSKILNNLLRFQMSYQGLVISDDLEMKAILDRYEWKEVVVRAVNAGVDILLVCKSQDIQMQVFEALIEAAATQEIPLERVKEAIKKIKKLKKKYLKDPRPFPQDRWKTIVGCKAHKDIVSNINQYA